MLGAAPQFMGSTLTLGTPDAVAGYAGDENEPVFSRDEIEQLLMRRLNPLAALTASTLTSALDAFDNGELAPAARLWEKMARRERWLANVKSKREEAIALRPWLVEKTEDTPEAEDQQTVLENFWRGVRAGHALNRHVTGGFALLVTQMMESVSYFYAAHHLRWAPDAAQTFKLPSGRSVPALGLTFEQVPLEYFEARTGELRFLGGDLAYTGTPLAPRAWMITTGPGLMIAASIALYEARLARHDRLNLSEKWGQPAVLGHTTAAKNSDQGKAMAAAVRSVAANYRGAFYGSDRNAIETLWPTGGGGGSATPMKEIMDDVRRDIVTLYIGSDLSTISRGGAEGGVGASVQGASEADRQRADCQRLSETLAEISRIVIAWYFGDSARVLARLVIEAPDNENTTALVTAVQAVVGMGGEVPVAPVAKRLNVPLAKTGETILQKPAAGPVPPAAINAAPAGADGPVLGKLMAAARDLFAEQTAADLQPLRTAISKVLQGDDAGLLDRARALYAALPALGEKIIAANGNAKALYRILSAAMAEGLSTKP